MPGSSLGRETPIASLNSRIPVPSERPISGGFVAPKVSGITPKTSRIKGDNEDSPWPERHDKGVLLPRGERNPGGKRGMNSSPEPAQPNESSPTVDDFRAALRTLPNDELLGVLDQVLLELEKRLLRYAKVGHELIDMANEGVVLAVRADARLQQAQSSAQHATGHLQVVGVGEWSPRSTSPSWRDDPRVTGEDD
jgi:hypothetical protein